MLDYSRVMKKNKYGFGVVEVLLIVVAVAIAGFVAWYVLHAKTSTDKILQNTTLGQGQTVKTPKAKTSSTGNKTTNAKPVSLDKAVESLKTANLFQKCETNVINDQADWQDSPASVLYRDWNGDNVEDVLVYAKQPGTMGYSRGCVYTMDAGALKQLWRLDDSSLLAQSDFSVNDKKQIVYSGKQTTGSGIQDTFVLYQWDPVAKIFKAQD